MIQSIYQFVLVISILLISGSAWSLDIDYQEFDRDVAIYLLNVHRSFYGDDPSFKKFEREYEYLERHNNQDGFRRIFQANAINSARRGYKRSNGQFVRALHLGAFNRPNSILSSRSFYRKYPVNRINAVRALNSGNVTRTQLIRQFFAKTLSKNRLAPLMKKLSVTTARGLVINNPSFSSSGVKLLIDLDITKNASGLDAKQTADKYCKRVGRQKAVDYATGYRKGYHFTYFRAGSFRVVRYGGRLLTRNGQVLTAVVCQ